MAIIEKPSVSMSSSYLGALRTEGLHMKSGNKIITDAPLDNNGKGEAYSPTDLVCASLASCMMTIMGIAARKEGKDLDGMSVEITKIMQSNPRKISEIHLNFHWNTDETDQDYLDMLKEKGLVCPVALSLSPEIKQVVTFNF